MESIKKSKLETKDLILININKLNQIQKETFVKQQVEEFEDEEIINNTGICEFLKGREYNIEDTKKFMNLETDRYVFVIYNKQNKLVGVIGIESINRYNKTGDLGYWISKNQRRKRYISQAIKIFLQSCIQDLKLNKINSSAFDYNIGSNKVLQNIGFKQIGIKKENRFRNGEYCDENMYELFQKDLKI
jgi:ribosomal-protein-alanine N-acetyltransferase